MKRIIILSLFMTFVMTVQAQNNLSLIEVEGISEVSLLPDEALISVSLSEKAMNVAEATNGLNQKTRSIEDALKKSGVKDYNLTIDNYYVYVNRIYTRGTSRDSGFVASQNLKVKVMDIENDLVKITETLHQAGNMGFNVAMQISDRLKKETEEQLLEKAIEDAVRKANVIAKSIGVENIQVHKVNYTSSRNQFYPVLREARVASSMDASVREEPVFRPEERRLSDKVLVTFTFER
jgi:uncharacterized protein YggE